jgi:hypothetical protein
MQDLADLADLLPHTATAAEPERTLAVVPVGSGSAFTER